MTTKSKASAKSNLRAQAKVDQYEKEIWKKRPIRTISSDSKGFKASLGYKKDGKRAFRRFGKNYDFALAVKDLWNQSIKINDSVLLESLDITYALRTRLAVEKLKGLPIDLLDCAEFFIEHAMPSQGVILVSDAIDKFMEIQKEEGNRPATSSENHTNYKTYFKPFREHFAGTKLIGLSADKVKQYFRKKSTKWSARTWNSHRSRLLGFWNKLSRQNYCSKALNPFETLPIKKEGSQSARISKKVSSSKTTMLFFHWLEQECRKYPSKFPELALSVFTWFCGIRVTEVTRIGWSGLNKNAEHLGNLEKKDFSGWEITVWGDQEKTSTSKVNPVPKNARYWLELCLESGEFKEDWIAHRRWEKRKQNLWRKFREFSGKELDQNTGRHSFTSHHLALYGDSPLTALRLGHPDPRTLYSNYRAGLSPSDAKKYFSIIPTVTEARLEAERETRRKEAREEAWAEAMNLSNCGQVVEIDGNPVPVQDESLF